MARRSFDGASDVALLATGKSQAEVAALRHLREAYDALGVVTNKSDSASSRHGLTSPEKHGRPRSSSSRVVNTVRALQHNQSAAHGDIYRFLFDQWLTLETLARSVDADAAAVHREIQTCDVKASEIVQLPIEVVDVGEPKLQVLREVLGEDAFANYVADLFRELAAFRQRCSLYGDTLRLFVDDCKMQCIGSHRIRGVMSHSDWLEIANAALAKIHNDAPSPVLVSHFPVLMRHCSPPQRREADENVVVVTELLQLLGRLPPARSRLVSLCFEQIGDVRRGSGTAPPPDGVRPHKLTALAKQSHADALCSREELDEILDWIDALQANDEASVTMEAFLSFHIPISDSFVNEDAEFATYLMRVWRFELAHELAIDDVMANYEARCQQLTNKARKVEVWKKLDHLRAAFPSKLAAMRLELTQATTISVSTAVQFKALELQHQIVGLTLAGLRELRLTGLCLRVFPTFVSVLPQLEELDLSENELHEPLPLEIICTMSTLKRLILNGNRLNDRSFSLATAAGGLGGVETVELARNELSIIPAAVLHSKSLKRLGVAGNKLRGCGVGSEILKQRLSRGFPKLQVIDVRENELSALPNELFLTGQGSLEVINTQDNRLAELPPSFKELTQLSEVVLSRNSLKSTAIEGISELLARCVKWKELTMDHNTLKQFPLQPPSTELNIHGLVAIRLHKNRIRSLPPLLNVILAACEELDLHGNALTDISESFFPAFPALRVCLLQHNSLKRLPESVASCQRLHTLEVYENRLEYVPPTLGELKELAVLNLRDNQLTTIPTEWHAFASYYQLSHHLRPRVLQTLYLQRNPLKNRVLQTLVDGALPGSGGGGRGADRSVTTTSTPATPFKSSATQICEMYVRKFIDTLKQSVPVQSLARAVHAEKLDYEDGNDGSDDEHRPRRRKWKGRARFVIQHVEAQLRSRCDNTDKGRERLLLAAAAFKKLLQKLLVASTQKELQLMSERFQGGSGVVDGLDFLCGVEAMGLFDSLRPVENNAGKRGSIVERCESVRKPVDAVASILQYLQVAHEQKSRNPTTDKESQATGMNSHKPETHTRPQSAPATANARRVQSSATTPRGLNTTNDLDRKSHREATLHAAKESAEQAERKQHETEVQRQRQRIQVLEQQLLDQQLLRLAEQRTHLTTAGDPASLSVATVSPPANGSLIVHVKQLNSERKEAQTKPELVVIAVSPEATVLQLKEAIAARLRVTVDRQILIAKNLAVPRNTFVFVMTQRSQRTVRRVATTHGGGRFLSSSVTSSAWTGRRSDHRRW